MHPKLFPTTWATWKKPEKENQIISFERRVIHDKVNWASSSTKLTNVQVEPTKKIEEAHGTLQVDFANKRVGTEQFSNYEGYGRSFHYAGPTKPINFEVDNLGRIRTQIVVMDALHFKPHEIESQFEREKIDRELHKAFVAFVIPNGETDIPIATGNWGSGAFNGDLELKFLIQWMAASEAGRGLVVYHTIGDAMQTQAIKFMEAYLRKKNASMESYTRQLLATKNG
ncbi:Poly(ADP-ribose) glycohydrolase [Orchesella cincta]|uniref:Poly(ADP-ribose) glycohydrolase n=1 Tax=Orchesella cincta TaxID=48709 RepID=A0A1D2MAT3_ORCCI|nr:Poly(ADP-ribose) glycohydrolase [Orchesella cincta]